MQTIIKKIRPSTALYKLGSTVLGLGIGIGGSTGLVIGAASIFDCKIRPDINPAIGIAYMASTGTIKIAGYATVGAVTGGLMAVTAPISIPLLYLYVRDKTK